MEFSRQEYWSSWPFPFPGDLPNSGIEPKSPALQGDRFFTEWVTREAKEYWRRCSWARDQTLYIHFNWWLRHWRICLQCWRSGFSPWVGKIPWSREWLPTPVFLPGESRGQRSLAGYSPWGRRVRHDWVTNTNALSSKCIWMVAFKRWHGRLLWHHLAPSLYLSMAEPCTRPPELQPLGTGSPEILISWNF